MTKDFSYLEYNRSDGETTLVMLLVLTSLFAVLFIPPQFTDGKTHFLIFIVFCMSMPFVIGSLMGVQPQHFFSYMSWAHGQIHGKKGNDDLI